MKQINYIKAYNAIFEVASILSNEKEDRKVRANKAFQILSSDMIKAFYDVDMKYAHIFKERDYIQKLLIPYLYDNVMIID